MALDSTFREKFTSELTAAKRSGQMAAWVVAIGTGASAGLILFAQGQS